MSKEIESIRRMLLGYQNEIQKEIREIKDEMKKMRKACGTFDMEQVWLPSVKYNVMREKVLLLNNVFDNIEDIRCSEEF